ncbi:hypothetical protein AAX26_01314 [Aliarcobacter thereius]|uniref:Uncharacterized protein n=2 Tax=Aliarcobacter thereius TaxID=544718 RepID=A0A1C0B6Q5_9BACT|nr:hypothetical protein [Aliarcobacter thereius]OCL87006.1 hypothetical protein AAX26_01314 [Aliarcobacter thereius]OCL91189.1 hypothetical protein AAX25_01359 [Aliarcobacter thereius]OCL95960.1 hypothetical protein AA347_01449 [Aliarcobacter thereius LMG 24486]OCL99285.1 hypothetical protein AAX29_01097 [Aliarcobacter thereius]QBF16068.1 hypothetical protein ATH_1001 [Aliarcobacter thereius LMG 24486]
MIDIKKELIEEIKELLKISSNEKIDINPNYLNYFDEDELKDIVFRLIDKKVEHKKGNSTYLDEIYLKAKKNDI